MLLFVLWSRVPTPHGVRTPTFVQLEGGRYMTFGHRVEQGIGCHISRNLCAPESLAAQAELGPVGALSLGRFCAQERHIYISIYASSESGHMYAFNWPRTTEIQCSLIAGSPLGSHHTVECERDAGGHGDRSSAAGSHHQRCARWVSCSPTILLSQH